MSSGLSSNPYASSQIIASGIGDQVAEGGTDNQDRAALGELDSRQIELQRRWRWYRCANYSNRAVDWDGNAVVDHIQHDGIASAGYVPPGFVDVGMKMLPVKFRKPTAPYYIPQEVVDRFTSLLFGQGRQPEISIEDNEDDTDYVNEVLKLGKFWPAMKRLRTFGGGMGSGAIGFCLVDGEPYFEVHDPRWCFPVFKPRSNNKLELLEKRYVYEKTIDGVKGQFWYRRVIDEECDEIWEDVIYDKDEEPNWDRLSALGASNRVEHKLGFCPVVWVKNRDIEEEMIDGDEDCHGVYDTIEAIDQLISQAIRAAKANCAPTLHIASDAELSQGVTMGSEDQALQTEKGASAEYLEIEGGGIKVAMELTKTLKMQAFEMAACVPDDFEGASSIQPKTATEVIQKVSRMVERADDYRDQYGAMIEVLLNIVIRVCLKAVQEKPANNGIVQGYINLRPRRIKNDDGTVTKYERVLSDEAQYCEIQLQWPPYFKPTLDDIVKACQAASTAYQAGAIDLETVGKFLKAYLPIEDVKKMTAKIDQAMQAQQELTAQDVMDGISKRAA